MALVLVVENGTGLANANTYSTREEANTYFEAHLYSSVWDAATDANKDRALVMATRLLDTEVQWDGQRTTLTQALAWPRSNTWNKDSQQILNNIVPLQVKNATAELARFLLSKDRTAEPDSLGVKSVEVDTVKVVFDKEDQPTVLPEFVSAIVAELGSVEQSGFGSVKLTRV